MEFIVIAILLTVTGAQLSQLEGPQNTLSIVGSNVTLKCSTPSGNCSYVDWEKRTPQNNPETVFSDRRGILRTYRDRYSVDNLSGCDLVINDVNLTDAGRFICRVFIPLNAYDRSAYLIVLETQTKCATNASLDDTVEGDGVQVTCEVTYSGINKASMLWKGVKDAPAAVENGKTIRRSHSIVASAPEVPSFTCVTSFEAKAVNDNGTKIIGVASNVPTTSCETSAIKVLYSVRDVILSPSRSYYAPGTTITCMARGYPLPSFKWQLQESENERTWMDIHNQNSSEFSVRCATARRYRCVAMNAVRGKSYNANSQEFQINNTVYDGVSIGIGFGIGLLAAILLASIAFASLVKLGCLEFRWRSANHRRADAVQNMKQEKSPSSHQLSSIPSRETPSVGQQESAYASLGNDRDTNEYESLEQRQKVKAKKKSRP